MWFFRKHKTPDRNRSTHSNQTTHQTTLARLRPLRCEPLEDRRMLSITLFVDDDATSGGDGLGWGTAYSDLQSALTQAAAFNADVDTTNDVDKIWIAEGTYYPSAELEPGYARSASFSLVDGVSLYGGFIGTETLLDERDLSANHETIFSGDLGVIGSISDNAYTVVYCNEGIEAAFDGLSITDGNANTYSYTAHLEKRLGGGIYNNKGTLTLANVVIADNAANYQNSFDESHGGGIYNFYGFLSLDDCVVVNNSAARNGGGIYNVGGTAIITDCMFEGNSASDSGGAISNSSGSLTITNSTISSNSAEAGGGVHNGNGTLSITNCIIINNSTESYGGGINNSGTLAITNSTLFGNSANGGVSNSGGGIYSTNSFTTFTLNNTIVAGNTNRSRSSDINVASGTLFGSHNLIGDGTGQTLMDGTDGNQVGTADSPINPMLSPLTQFDNGLWGHYLLAGSPAIDAGDNALAVDASGEALAEDIIGSTRIVDIIVDIGAVEGVAPSSPSQTYIVTSLDETVANDGVLTFLEAFKAANSNQPIGDAPAGSITEPDTIQFDSALFANGVIQTIFVDDGELTILGDLNLEGPGMEFLVFDAAGRNRVFHISSGISVNLEGITITGGSTSDEGGGIYNSGMLTIANSMISENSASSGGGIFNNGVLAITNTTIWNNSASSGGGIYNNKKATVVNVVISGNAASNGGGICNYRTLYVTNSTIVSNTGNGIFIYGGYSLSDSSTSIINNTILANNIGIYSSMSKGDIAFEWPGIVRVTGCNNLIGNGGYYPFPPFIDGVDGNQVGSYNAPIDPMLSNLTQFDNGLWGYYLLPGSPAIDAGANELAIDPTGQPLLVDMTGKPRIIDDTVDIGAMEGAASRPATTYLVTSLEYTIANDGILTFVEAFEAAQRNQPVGDAVAGSFSERDTIQFADGVSGTFFLDGEELAIVGSLSIEGPGTELLTFDAGGQSRVFSIHRNASMSLSGLTITGGFAQRGGGIYNDGTLTVTNCTISGNSASESGGGIFKSSGTLTIVNSILVGNSAKYSAGIQNYQGACTITNSTFADNPGEYEGSAMSSSASTLTVTNSILWQNHGLALTGQGSFFASNNLVGIDPCFVRDPSDGGDGWGDNPDTIDIDESANDDYGDLRLTSLSPAINYGNNGSLPLDTEDLDNDGDQSEPLPLDADGNPRVYDTAVDCGAFEFQSAIAAGRETPSLLVTTANDLFDLYDGQISLREAIWYAGAGLSTATVSFDTSLNKSTILLAGRPIWIGKSVIVDASPLTAITIEADGKSRVFTLGMQSGEEVELIGLTISGGGIYNTGALTIKNSTLSGNSASSDVGIYNSGYRIATVTIINSTISGYSAGNGGGIYNQGIMTIVGCMLLNNSASFSGGGIYNGGTMTITDSKLLSNEADHDGGGIYNGGTLTVTNSTVSGNTASNDGGGICTSGTLTVIDSILSNNLAEGGSSSFSGDGGGIYNRGTMTITDSKLLNNEADHDGGGIYNGGTLTVTNSTISCNLAKGDSSFFRDGGGGIYNDRTLTATNCTISGNSALYGGGIYNYAFASGKATLNNTIVAENVASTGPDLYNKPNAVLSGSYNLIGNGDEQTELIDGVDGNLVGTAAATIDPKLDTLGRPLSGSLAINAGSNDLIPDNTITDLDGNYRIANGTVDIGAYEFNSTPLLAGDANGDGKVDGSDVTILAGNWQAGVAGTPNATWTMGDFNHDGKVDGSDVTILAGNWQAGVSSTVVAVSESEKEDEPEEEVAQFVPPASGSLGVATVPRRESLPARRFIKPTSEVTDAVLTEVAWSESDYTAVAKDLVVVSVKKSATASDKLFTAELDSYADFD